MFLRPLRSATAPITTAEFNGALAIWPPPPRLEPLSLLLPFGYRVIFAIEMSDGPPRGRLALSHPSDPPPCTCWLGLSPTKRRMICTASAVLSASTRIASANPSAIILAPSNGLSRDRLRRVRDYIETHLDDRLTLTDLAGIACLSPYHFSRSFKEAVGIGPRRYVMQRRLDRAKTLIRGTNQPLPRSLTRSGFATRAI
jgi:AraC-like DNA-binding protein